jgi:Uma2 family endonuclease
MSTAVIERLAESRSAISRFDTAAEWIVALGGVELRRILVNPPPGTATELDLLNRLENEPKQLVELIDGTLVEKPMGQLESLLARLIATRLGIFVDANELGDVYGADCPIRMSTRNVRLPDVSFVERKLSGRPLTTERVLDTWPDLAVEVISESNTRAELDRKRLELFQLGTRLIWQVDWRTQSVEVYTSPDKPARVVTGPAKLSAEPVIPLFELDLAELWRKASSAR